MIIMDINASKKNNIIYGLAEISLYLANIGENEYSNTVEEACRMIQERRLISSNIRLPEKYVDVLVYGEQFGYAIMRLSDSDVYYDDIEWVGDHDYATGVKDTWWMPLQKVEDG